MFDSLNAVFLAGCNNKNPASIMKTVADNAIVMNDSLTRESGGVKALSTIKIVSSVKDNVFIAYGGGTYTLNLTPLTSFLKK